MNAPLPPDPYRILGVDASADPGTIKTAYRKLVLKCHPDKVQDPALKAIKQEEFQRVQQAYEILSDEDKRREYDLELKAKRLREELYKNGGAAGTPPKKYYNVNIKTAEPPASFGSSPQPPSQKGYSPYSGQPHFSSSWEREVPSRPKPSYDDDRRARRAPSYEETAKEEELKEERRRRKDQEREREEQLYRREKERERERKREKERERERKEEKERERERVRAERERAEKEAAKAEKKRLEREREKERDRAHRREREEKTRSKSKPAYVEHYSGSDDEYKTKKTSLSNRKHSDSPSRDKSARRDRDRSPRKDVNREVKQHTQMSFAADYMDSVRRKGSKSGPAHGYPDQPPVPSYSSAYPDPNEWHASGQPAPRRGSQDAKYPSMSDPVIIDAGSPAFKGSEMSGSPHDGRPPRLQKSFTSPVGTMPTSQAGPRMPPSLNRSQTMQPEYSPRSSGGPQGSPAGPLPDKYSSKHPSTRMRRNSYDAYAEDEMHRGSGHHRSSKGSGGYVRVYQVDEADTPRVVESSRYADAYADPYAAQFPKVKVAPRYGSGPVYESKRFTEDDVAYSRQYAYA
ncbi:Molecular chaperone DnaJ [Pleurostoma richardsiae]|uniref:Molecular chaperone DnaJ n=1 Tax=Pleurostoma richardsiae TaxID=41990 RepID=A0AA38RBB5_9PEZI|nr:Molecular chaperone DnaJ [Pleurostoma richardsiae]